MNLAKLIYKRPSPAEPTPAEFIYESPFYLRYSQCPCSFLLQEVGRTIDAPGLIWPPFERLAVIGILLRHSHKLLFDGEDCDLGVLFIADPEQYALHALRCFAEGRTAPPPPPDPLAEKIHRETGLPREKVERLALYWGTRS